MRVSSLSVLAFVLLVHGAGCATSSSSAAPETARDTTANQRAQEACVSSPAHTSGEHAHDGAPHHHGPHAHAHSPSDAAVDGAEGVVIAHESLRHFENNGNDLVGIATPSLGSREHEVWRSTIAVGSQTPLHTHESEEIFVFLRGTGRAEIGGKVTEFSAPATVIAPAHVPHQFFNTGNEPTDAIVIVRLGSTIVDAQGAPLQLPWRK